MYLYSIIPRLKFLESFKTHLIYRNLSYISGKRQIKSKKLIFNRINKRFFTSGSTEVNLDVRNDVDSQFLLSSEFRDPNGSEVETIDDLLNKIRDSDFREIDEYMFERIDKSILTNLDQFTITDFSHLLQLTLKNYYSQNLIEGLVLKLEKSKPSELHIGTLALIIQNLGRIQPSNVELHRLTEFFDQVCELVLKIDISESHFSSIVYGFQRLHYTNQDFLENVSNRYKKNNSYNVNSLTISLSSIVKMDYFNPKFILSVYKILSKSLSHMTLQTQVQLISTIAKVHEFYNTNTAQMLQPGEPIGDVLSFNYKLMNYLLKIICTNYLSQLTVSQISIILYTMNKLQFKKATQLNKLIKQIPYQTNISNSDSQASEDTVDAALKNKNVSFFIRIPNCPFDYDLTLKKLSNVEVNNLVLICDAISGLDYYNEYTVNLLLIIKDIINPILHELKSNNILMYMLSYVNLNSNTPILKSMDRNKFRNKKNVSKEQLEMILRLLNYYENYDNNWYNQNKQGIEDMRSEVGNDLVKRLKSRLSRIYWKEEIILNGFENLLRHVNYIKSSKKMLQKFKLLYNTFIYNIYIESFPLYININEFNKDISSMRIPLVIPENLIHIYNELYNYNSSQLENCDGVDEADEEIETEVEEDERREEVIELNRGKMYLNKVINGFTVDILISES